ncbi:MAG: glutamine amidotransferase [Armatimonadota bacterium]
MIRFSHPQYLLLLPLVWVYTWWVLRNSLAELGRVRGRLAAGFRGVLLTLLVLALAGVQFVRPTTTLCTVFVIDVSDSVSSRLRTEALDYIRQATKHMKKTDDRAALVVFGGEAQLDHDTDDYAVLKNVRGIYSIPSTSRTDIAAGIQLAMATFPPEAGKQVILFTDGNENLGNALEQSELAKTNDVRISVVPLARDTSRGEALLLRVENPTEVRQGAPFQVNVLAESIEETDGTITLFRNNQPVETRKVHLKPGKTVVAFEQSAPNAGLYNYRAVLDVPADRDTVPDNNVAYAYTRVSGKPTMLIVEGTAGEGAQLTETLQAHDIDVELAGADRIPANLAECTRYDSIVFANVPSWRMSSAQMAVIRSAVRDTGMGFAMIGGDESFGAGGYYHTPIEDVLPVSMDIRKKKIMPALAIALIIENLEIMQITNTSIDAAKACVDLLEPIDQLGVLGCNDYSGWGGSINSSRGLRWEIPIQSAENKGSLKSKLDSMSDLGDPPGYSPYLLEAAKRLAQTNAAVRHIVLIGDGDAVEPYPTIDPIIAKIRGMGVTVSTIATGIDGPPASKYMAHIASLGHGQSFTIKTPEDLPRYLVRDQQSVTKPPIYEKKFLVHATADAGHQISRDIPWNSAPYLLGCNITSAKESPTVRVPLTGVEDDPVLAAWNYGLGRTVAFTSDASQHWGAPWVVWDQYAPFWAKALRWTLRPTFKADMQTMLTEEGGKAKITVDAVTQDGEFRNLLDLQAKVSHIDPDAPEGHEATETTVTLEQTAPGHYEGNFDARGIGTYAVTVVEKEGAETKSMQMATLVIPYSPEYQTVQPNGPLMSKIVEQTGGVESPPAEDVFGKMRFGSRSLHDLWPLFALIVSLLFLIDVAVRRVLMPWDEIFALARNAILRRLPRRRRAGEAPEAEHAPVLGTLLNTKEHTRQPKESASLAGNLRAVRDRQKDDFRPQEPEPSLLQESEPDAAPEPEPEPEKPKISSGTVGTLLQKKRERGGK